MKSLTSNRGNDSRETGGRRGHVRRYLCGLAVAALLAFPVVPAPADGVVINELMYHPYDGWNTNAAGTWVIVTNETEYIELYNSGTNAVDLLTYRFDNGVSYDFPVGATLATGA